MWIGWGHFPTGMKTLPYNMKHKHRPTSILRLYQADIRGGYTVQLSVKWFKNNSTTNALRTNKLDSILTRDKISNFHTKATKRINIFQRE